MTSPSGVGGASVPDPTEVVAEILLADYATEYSADHLTWRDFTTPARAVVAAVESLLRAKIADELRACAAGRREYAQNAPAETMALLTREAATLDNAAAVAEGNEDTVRALLPSWRWAVPVPAADEPADHCPSCHRPLPHNDVERRACPAVQTAPEPEPDEVHCILPKDHEGDCATAADQQHSMLPGSHERPGGAECRCGAAWDRWNDRCRGRER